MPAKIRVTRVVGDQPVPTGACVESESQVAAWRREIRTMRASPSKFLHVTEKQYIVAETTIELVLMDHRQPSRAEIAEAVRRKGYCCSEETVRRTHNQLRDAGLLGWTQQYDIGWRMTQFQVRVRQARQTTNSYQFYLPKYVTFITPEACGRGTRKPRRPHSCDRLSVPAPQPGASPGSIGSVPGRGFDPQLAGVNLNDKFNSSSIRSGDGDLLRKRQVEVANNLLREAQQRHVQRLGLATAGCRKPVTPCPQALWDHTRSRS